MSRPAVLLGIVLLASCTPRDRTEVLLIVDAEPAVRDEATHLELQVRGASADDARRPSEWPSRYAETVAADRWPVTLGLIPEAEDASRRYYVRANARAGAEVIAQVRAISGYVSGETLELRLVLEDACLRTSCAPEQTCHAGVCEEPAFVPPTGPPDAGPRDAGPGDAGLRDAGAEDANRVDADLRCPSGPGCVDVDPANVGAELFDARASDVLIDADSTFDTGTCMGVGRAGPQMQGDGTQVCVVASGAFVVPSGVTWTITGPHPLIVLANGEIRIDGDILAAAGPSGPGPAGGAGGEGVGAATGPLPGGNGSAVMMGDSGGGGGSLCGPGAIGGSGGSASGGPAAAAVPRRPLEPLQGGSGGGRGSGTFDTAGHGGDGGGAIQLTSRIRIVVAGVIDVSGGGGSGGRFPPTCSNPGAGGGGGSGGSILLEAPIVEATLLLANGGGGGGGAGVCGTAEGTAGADGRGSTAPTMGGMAGSPDGQPGGSGAGGSSGGGTSPMPATLNGGGGGGGGGCILVRSSAGVLPPTLMTSPSNSSLVWAAPLETR